MELNPQSAVMARRLRPFADSGTDVIGTDDFVFDAPGAEAVAAGCGGIVLATGDEARAATLLGIGAPLIFIGEAALRDSGSIQRLATAFGTERIGVYAPLRRQRVSWSFETTANADFKTVAPSYCEPAWELLLADGTGTGTLAPWWLGAVRQLGASHFLIDAAIDDDTDLNLCADLVERLGPALWLHAASGSAMPVEDWIRYGQARRLALGDGQALPMAEREAA